MARKRRPHAVEFKAKVALAAVCGLKTTSELASEFGSHLTQIAKGKLDGVLSTSQAPLNPPW